MKLLSREWDGPFTESYYLHNGEDNKDRITIQKTQDCEPVIKRVKSIAQAQKTTEGPMGGGLVGSVPLVIVDDFCQKNAVKWGLRPREVLAELLKNNTDRANAAWATFLKGRDYRKLQAKSY